MAGYDLTEDKLYGHVTKRKGRVKFLAFCRYLRSLWAAENNVELAYVPFYGSWLNGIEAQFTALRYFALDGTDHNSHAEQATMIRRYIGWRNHHAASHPKPRQAIAKAETINRAKVA
jgi:ATP-dependent helicase YprA (DUF1998 family)